MFAIGKTTVLCTATDAAGNAANGQFSVQVKGAVEQLADLRRAVLGVGPGTSLVDKVRETEAYLNLHNVTGACTTLNSFISLVRAQSVKSIPTSTAVALITDATRITAVLGC